MWGGRPIVLHAARSIEAQEGARLALGGSGRDEGDDEFGDCFALRLGAQIPQRQFEPSVGNVQQAVAGGFGREIRVKRIAANETGLERVEPLAHERRVAIGRGFGNALQAGVRVDDDDGTVGFFHVEGGAEPLAVGLVGTGEAEGAEVGDFHGASHIQFREKRAKVRRS